jgi:hypothetical protein
VFGTDNRRTGLAGAPQGAPRRSFLLLFLLPVLATVASCDTNGGAPPPTEQPPPAAPAPVTPRGAVSLPFSFTWTAVPGGNWTYRVIVTDAAERPLLQHDVRHQTTFSPPSELKAMLAEQHATFAWSIAIVTPDGRHLARSAPVPFFLK